MFQIGKMILSGVIIILGIGKVGAIMVDLLTINLLLFFAMLVVTIYRAVIEKQNLKARKKVKELFKIIEAEKDILENTSALEFVDFLEKYFKE